MAVGSLDSARLALDARSLDGLKRAAVRDPQAQLQEAARQFEALFLNQMMKSMRKAGMSSQLIDNRQVQFYQSLLDQQLSQQLAGKGLGQSDMLVRQLSTNTHGPSTGSVGTPASSAPAPVPAVTHGDDTGTAEVDALIDSVRQAVSMVSGTDAARAGADDDGADRHDASGRFVRRFSAAAEAAARASGVPALLILAQAALETGWGRHETRAADGSGGHNLFGIKAGAGWKGARTRNATHEYVDGTRITARESFRVYDSYADSFADHARLIGRDPRYAAVRQATSPEQAAHALQASGYATDPRYAEKLISVMHRIDRLAAR